MDWRWLGTSPDSNKRKRADAQADYISFMMQSNPKHLLSESPLFNGLTQFQLPFNLTRIRGLPFTQYHAQIQLHYPDGMVRFGNGVAQTIHESTRVAAIDACKQLQERGLLVGVKKSNAERAGWGHMSSNKTMVPSAAFRDLPIILHSSGPDHAKVDGLEKQNFVAELTVPLRNNGVYFAMGQARKKAEAERACCRAACEALQQLGYLQKPNEKDLKGDVALLIRHFNQFGDSKTIAEVEYYDRVRDQSHGRFEKVVDGNSNKFEACSQQHVTMQNVVKEINELRAKAEEDKRKMEEKHKQDLEVHTNASLKAEFQNKNLLWHHNVLIEKTAKLEKEHCEMKQAEVLTKQRSEDERLQCERVKQEALRQLEEVKKQAEINASLQLSQRIELKKMFEMHKGETKAQVITPQDQKMKLVQMQNLELEKQRVAEMLEMEKGREADKVIITDLEDQQEYLQSMVNDLIFKERTSNDELEGARKVALKILRKYGSEEEIGIKDAGSIDKQPWEGPCRKKYMRDENGWDMKMGLLISEWEELLRDPCYWPLRVVEVVPNKCEFRIVEDDEKLMQLKGDLGDEVCKTVTDAFLEMEEYNASGRSSVEVAWDFEKNQRVSLKDLLLYLKDLLDAPNKQSKGLKRQRGHYS